MLYAGLSKLPLPIYEYRNLRSLACACKISLLLYFSFFLHYYSSLLLFRWFFTFLLHFFLLFFFLEIKRNRVDAVTFPRRCRPVFKNMPQVASATGTDYFDPVHEVAGVFFEPYLVTGNHIGETWPASS